MQSPLPLLNQLSPSQFLAEYWQKKPLLIRQAIPDFQGILNGNDLAGLACEDEVQSRIVSFKQDKWHVAHGPFDESVFAQLPAKDWTLLVQGVNHFIPEADALLRQFSFIPYARLDDLMVSYAPIGGGVGPHFDSYDVFLLQGSGQRRWKVSHQSEKNLVQDAPLRILKDFTCSEEWVLNPGDMLYLPPQIAHWGIAETDDCMTYSIGFRAPKTRELASAFLEFIQSCESHHTDDPLYQDADLRVSQSPAEISEDMISRVQRMLMEMPWQKNLLGLFLGQYLSEPKQHVLFDANAKLSLTAFEKKAIRKGICLDLKSRLLYWHKHYYLNGERLPSQLSENCCELLEQLANNRMLSGEQLKTTEDIIPVLHAYYLAGYCQFIED